MENLCTGGRPRKDAARDGYWAPGWPGLAAVRWRCVGRLGRANRKETRRG